MQNVLVFPCGSGIALEIHRSLRYSKHFRLFGANSVPDHGRFVYENYISDIPFASEEQFIPAMKNIVSKYNIDYIYPTMDAIITILKRNEQELGCYVVASPVETTEVCLSKKRTYDVLCQVLRTPREYKKQDKIEFPVFCKPDIGYGSRTALIIKDRLSLEEHLRQHPDALILEYLPGEEYTIDCFTDKERVLLFCGARIRNRVLNGISVNTVSIGRDKAFREIAEKINSVLEFRGAWFVQLKRGADGKLTLLEIASRLGGSSALYRARGINFAQLSLFDAMGADVSIIDNGYGVELDRALDNRFKIEVEYDEAFIDYDDTIILNKQEFNLEVVKFLYYCRNRRIKITLLSRHKGDLEGELEQIHLSHLFDRVIHIGPKDNKAGYIDNICSIFIDDSFEERKQVWEQKKIPVFSVDMIECLM